MSALFEHKVAELKRAAMLFDDFIFPFLPIVLATDHSEHALATRAWLADHDFLAAKGMIRHYSELPHGKAAYDRAFEFAIKESVSGPPSLDSRVFDVGAWSRMFASELGRVSALEASPVFADQFDDLATSSPGRHQVLRAVLNALPMPSADTPWEAILDWRADGDAARKFRRVRHWIHDAARRNLTIYEADTEIRTLLDEYDAYMAAQHRKFNRSRVEIIVITSAEFLEDLVHAKISSALQRLFDLRRAEVAAFESEMSAPGRALAYISSATARFA